MRKKESMQVYTKITGILVILLMVFSTGFSNLPVGVLQGEIPDPAETPTPIEEPAPKEEPVEVTTTEPRRAAVTPPEMDVLCIATAVSIPDGDTSPTVDKCTDFGELEIVYTMDNHNLSVWNTGTLDLVLDGNPRVAVSGHTSDFSISLQPTTPITGGNHSQFDVMFTPTAVGLRTATITIENNDSDEDPYTFTVQGTGILTTTTTTITSDSPDPSDVDQSYTVTVTVTSPYATPTGTVDIDDGSGASCTATLSGGSGSCSLTSTSGGAKTLTANYSGDSNHATSSDTEPHSVTYTEDNYEENDTLPSAFDLSSDEDTWLSTIGGPGYQVDDDWYEIYVSSGYELVQVEAQFTHSGGDINIGLFDSMGILQDDSTSTTDNESINFTVPSAGTYYIEVYGSNTGNEYDLWWDNLSPPAQTLTVSKSGTGSGTVTSVPSGIDCGSDCSEAYAYGTSVTLTASPDSGITFAGWSGDCSGAGTCVLSMTADRSATAVFTDSSDDNYEPNDTPITAYDLSLKASIWLEDINGMGIQADDDWYEITVTPGNERVLIDVQFTHSAGDIDVALYDSTETCLADSISTTDNEYINHVVPSAGTYYIKVYNGNAGNEYDLWWDYVNPSTNHTLTVTKTGTGGGTVSSSPPGIDCGGDCSEVFSNGTSVTLTASPDADSIFTKWSGDCSGTGTCVLSMTANQSATANFNLAPPVPIAPIGNITDRTPTYKWEPMVGATKYKLQVIRRGTVLLTQTVKANACTASECSFTPNLKLKFITHKWRVRAKVGGVWTSYQRPKIAFTPIR